MAQVSTQVENTVTDTDQDRARQNPYCRQHHLPEPAILSQLVLKCTLCMCNSDSMLEIGAYVAAILISPLHMKRIMSNQGRTAGFGRDLSGSVGLSLLPACDTCMHVFTLSISLPCCLKVRSQPQSSSDRAEQVVLDGDHASEPEMQVCAAHTLGA